MKQHMRTEMMFWLYEQQRQGDVKMTHAFCKAADKDAKSPDVNVTKPAADKGLKYNLRQI